MILNPREVDDSFLPVEGGGLFLEGPPKPSTQPGSRQRISLARMLHSLGELRFTGVLRIVGSGSRHEIYLRGGRIVHVRLPTFELPLGDILCAMGLLDRGTYARSLMRIATEGRRHGSVLIHMGIVTDEQVATALTEQTLRRAETVFRIRGGRYGIDEHDHEFGRDQDQAAAGLEVRRVIYHGVRTSYGESELAGEMRSLAMTEFRLRRSEAHALESFVFSGDAWPVLMALGRGEFWRLSELVALSSQSRRDSSYELMTRRDVLEVVYVLFVTNALERQRLEPGL